MIIANKKRIIKIEKIRNKYNNLYFANKFVMLCYVMLLSFFYKFSIKYLVYINTTKIRMFLLKNN